MYRHDKITNQIKQITTRGTGIVEENKKAAKDRNRYADGIKVYAEEV